MKLREVDRSMWGRGEWDNEPDRVDFIHAGFACFILRNHSGAWCGYVGVPSTHPCYEKDYDDVSVDVHGGLTYANNCSGTICHVPEPGMPDDVWWLGFDTGHYMDISPFDWNRLGLDYEPLHGSYKNVEYVTNEVKSLADQLQKLDSPQLGCD